MLLSDNLTSRFGDNSKLEHFHSGWLSSVKNFNSQAETQTQNRIGFVFCNRFHIALIQKLRCFSNALTVATKA